MAACAAESASMTTNVDSPLLREPEVSDAIDLLGMPVHPVDFEQYYQWNDCRV